MSTVMRALRGVGAAIRARRRLFVGVAALVFLLTIFVPPLLLSVTRKAVDYFTFNPWLGKLPEYLGSGPGTLWHRLERTWNLALFWFSADGSFGVEWGFAVTFADLARFLLMSLLIAVYFALWFYRRDQLGPRGWGVTTSAHGGVLGAVSSVFGLATGGCTVMGCGAPVIPVVGLAFVGLSSTTLKWMAELSSIGTTVVMVGIALGVIYFGWQVGGPRPTPLPLQGRGTSSAEERAG